MTLRFVIRATLLAGASFIAIEAGTVARAAESEVESRREVFRMFDTDGDGKISRIEWELNNVNVIFRKTVHREAAIRREDTRLSQRAFNDLDRKHDGILDVHDIATAPPFQFGWWDKNQDGTIDWDEFSAGVDELER